MQIRLNNLNSYKRMFDDALPHGTLCEALATDICAEEIGLAPAVTTYGYMSSCIFYIHQGGGRVASFKNLIESRNSAFPALWTRFFPPVLDPLVRPYRMLEGSSQSNAA